MYIKYNNSLSDAMHADIFDRFQSLTYKSVSTNGKENTYISLHWFVANLTDYKTWAWG